MIKIVQFDNQLYALRSGLGIPIICPYRYLILDTNKSKWVTKRNPKMPKCLTPNFWVIKSQYEEFKGPIIPKIEGSGKVIDPKITLANLKLAGEKTEIEPWDDIDTLDDANKRLHNRLLHEMKLSQDGSG